MKAIKHNLDNSTLPSPFDLEDDRRYQLWRAKKLALSPRDVQELLVTVDSPQQLTVTERTALFDRLNRANMAVYQCGSGLVSKRVIRAFGVQLGLVRLDSNLCADDDGITSLHVAESRREGEYIPYTNKRLNWHTDGYYNGLDQQVRGVILHCVRPASEGGENAFLDHEIAYIQLRDENPEFIAALMAPDAMTVPPNVQNGREIRGEQPGPVFSVAADGQLHMRYSARARNIVWKQDTVTLAAAKSLLNLFQGDSPYIFRHRLTAGQGLISNNVLHCRTEFNHDSDQDQGRLLYRARYFDRVANLLPADECHAVS